MMSAATGVQWELYGGPRDGATVELVQDRRGYRCWVPWRVGMGYYAAILPEHVERKRLVWMGWC